MDLDKLRTLVELSRRGTMSAVAQATGYGTSAVSQQLAALERQAKVQLLEASGRRVRLTPAGPPAGRPRGADPGRGHRRRARPRRRRRSRAGWSGSRATRRLCASTCCRSRPSWPGRYPLLELEIQEHEPDEVDQLLDDDQIDLGFDYDYTLVPRGGRGVCTLLSTCEMRLAVHPDLDAAATRSGRRRTWRRSATRTGSATPATPPTTSWRPGCARSPAGSRGSGTGPTAWTWSSTWCSRRSGVCLLAEDAPEARRLRTVSVEFVRARAADVERRARRARRTGRRPTR